MALHKLTKREFLQLGFCGMGCAVLPGLMKAGNSINLSESLNKHTKEALFYEQTARGVICQICPNECSLKEGELSDCRNRINKGGKLYTIAYGNPCAVHVDPIEKKPLFHFLPSSNAFSIATAGCNLACLNCQNWEISQRSPRETRNYDLMPEMVVEQAVNNNCQSIAYTYSEPITFFEYTTDSSKIAKGKGIKDVLVSAGYINEKPLRYMAKYIDAANIDLKSFSDSIYLKLNAGKLDPILNTLKILREENVWLEITNLIVPGWTDNFDLIKKMCEWLNSNGLSDAPLHFSRFHPQYKLKQLPPTPLATLIKAREIAISEGIQFVYLGNVPGQEGSNTYCPECKELIIERRGYRIIQNHMKNGNCGKCNHKVPGVWS